MNLIAKCICCLCEPVCKYKEVYQKGVEAILNASIPSDNTGFWKVIDCPHVEVSIRCPHMIAKGAVPRGGEQG